MPGFYALSTDNSPQLYKYQELRAMFIVMLSNVPESDNILLLLKTEYRNEINSNRQFSRVHTMEQFLDTLESRRTLSPDDVSVLRNIAFNLTREYPYGGVLARHVEMYEYRWIRRGQALPTVPPLSPPVQDNHEQPVGHSILPFEVKDVIASQIGRKWRELARHLGLQNVTVDNISSQYQNDVISSMHQVLDTFEAKYNPNEVKEKLFEALRQARRTDLSIHVRDMLH